MNRLTDLFPSRVPYSSAGYTYIFVPRDFLRGLFGAYGMDLPTQFTEPNLALKDNDTIPSNIDPSTISYVGEFSLASLAFFLFNPYATESEWQSGQSVTFNTTIPHATSSQGWTTIEHVLMRIDTNFTPSGRFPVYWDDPSTQQRIGLDVAICVQKYEPWIIEVHNTSTGSPSALRIVGKGDDSTSPLPSGNIRGPPITNTRYLNTTGKDAAFSLAHGNSYIRTFQLDFTRNESWFNYTPPPLVSPIVPPRAAFLLTSTYFTGRLSDRWRWASRICRALSRPVRRHPRTGRCAQHSTLLRGVGTRCRAIIRG